jgi:hypothetical protein
MITVFTIGERNLFQNTNPGLPVVQQDDGSWVCYEVGDTLPTSPIPNPNPIIDPISMYQLRYILASAGELDSVDAYCTGTSATLAQKLFWVTQTVIYRNSPTLKELTDLFGLSSNDVDILFSSAPFAPL